MNIIVPMAGPDFELPTGEIKPLALVEGKTLFEKCAVSRWAAVASSGRPLKVIFVFRQGTRHEVFERYLAENAFFKGYSKAVIAHGTKGALFSALVGAALVTDPKVPIAVDLADVGFAWEGDPAAVFSDSDVHGALPIFRSSDPGFSYAAIRDGDVLETVEKRVISDHASTGVYLYRDLETFLLAASGTVADESLYVRGAAFLCPSMNGLIRRGLRVRALEIQGAQAFSLAFKKSS